MVPLELSGYPLMEGVNIKALSEYFFKATPSEHKFVINYSSVEKSNMKKAVQILADLIRFSPE